MVSPILLIAIPLFFAFSVPIWGLISKKLEKFVPSVAIALNLAVAVTFIPKAVSHPIIVWTAGFPPPFAINLTVGPLAVFMAIIIQMVGLFASFYLWNWEAPEPAEKFYMLFLLLILGVTGMVLTGDLFNLFVFLEITGISAYALTATPKDKAGTEAAMKYLILGSLGSTFVLLGIAILYATTGTLNMADIARKINQADRRILLLSAILFITGFGVEAEMFPLNGWVPDAYTGAPSPAVSMFVSGTAKAGIYAMARVLYTILGQPGIAHFLLLLGIITLLIGEFSALRQKNLRRLLAYSSIGQMGLIMLALGVGSLDAVSGGLFQAFNHAIGKALLFLGITLIFSEFGTYELDNLKGLGYRKPYLALLLTIGILSIMGMPPFSGFWSKIWILFAIVKHRLIVYASLALVGAIIEIAYYARVLKTFYGFSPALPQKIKTSPKPVSIFAISVLALILIVVGLFPHTISQYAVSAANELLQRKFYIEAVIQGGLK